MSARVRRAAGPSVSLILLCLLLGLVVYAEVALGPFDRVTLPRVSVPDEPAKLAAPEQIESLPPIETFAEIVERPMFIPSRRPIPPEEKAIEAGPQAVQGLFTLLGIVISSGERMAIMQRNKTKEVLRVVEGQEIDRWRVDEILMDRVVLRSEALTEEVELRDLMRAKPQKRRRRARRAQAAEQEAEPAESGAEPKPSEPDRQ